MNNLKSLKKIDDKISVLYVEKNKELQRKISNHLKQIFTNVYQATNGLDAMNIYSKKKPNIVILDLSLDKIDAIELIVNIQELNIKSNIIVISDENENYKLLKTIDMGLSEMMLKPINLNKLDFCIKKILTRIVPKATEKPVAKEIKKTQTVTKKIVKEVIKKEPLEQIKIKNNLSNTNCFDELKKHIYNKLDLINTYKGIHLQNSGIIEHCEENMFKVKVSKTQLIAAQYEKFTILKLESINKYIYAFVLNIDIKNKVLTLVKPKFIDYKLRSKLFSRIVVDKNFKASIFIKNKLIELGVKYISFNATSLFTQNNNIDISIGDELDLTLGFDLKSPSSLIKEKKFTKIFSKAKVIRIDKIKTGINIIVTLNIQKAGQNTFKKYLQNREMETIHEFKNRLRI